MSPREFTSDDYSHAELLQAGLDHLTAAEILLKNSPEVFDSAGYLAHMGFELMLKSWLLFSLGHFSGIHSLKALIKKMNCASCQLTFTEKELQTLDYLKNFEELRYPNRRNPVEIGSEDIDQIYELANAIWRQMPDQLVEDYEQIPFGKKSGRVLMERPESIPRDLQFETGIKS